MRSAEMNMVKMYHRWVDIENYVADENVVDNFF